MAALAFSFLTPGGASLPSLPLPPSPLAPLLREEPSGAGMGSRASTLLRDEELEEIKKETGCEFGSGVGPRPGASGRLQEDEGGGH